MLSGVKEIAIADDVSSRLHSDAMDVVVPYLDYDFVDFFSGCGGMSYGFHTLGRQTNAFSLVGAFDIDPYANQTFARNFGFEPSNLDLSQVAPADIRNILARHRSDEQKPLVVIGCAPCQGFSSHRKKDPRKDPRNSFVGKFAEIAVALNAEMVIMENVPDLLAKKHWYHYEAFHKTLENVGYHIKAKILNMAEFGVPQERFRAVVLASRRFTPTMPKPIFERTAFRTVRDAIGDLPPLAVGQTYADDPMHITSNHRKETIEILKQIPKDGGSRPPGVGPACLDRVAGFYDVYGRLAWDKPAITITARCRTPSCGRFTHPEQDRGLSVREAGLLQGFPADFVFEGPFDDKFKQIGNAVPPLFSLNLASHVLSLLRRQSDEFEEHNIRVPY